ncbi:amino acid permease/ SLC12A domain-containing protein [Pestalotiopsis sp. NC0098]|nr:amino acid permease/ SLC12A domain-containing protein [Pestalotiopsis sp. NC0098]
MAAPTGASLPVPVDKDEEKSAGLRRARVDSIGHPHDGAPGPDEGDRGDVIPPGVDPRFTVSEGVRRGLSQRHIQMIALAGAIGTGLFLGSGKSIQRAGPAGTLIGYAAIGGLVICVMLCLAELSALAPVSGAYVRHAGFFVDPALSFAIGWVAVYGPCVSVPSEWVAVSAVVRYWSADFHSGIVIAICLVVSFLTNIFLIRIFGEVELVSAMLKIALILGLILFGLIYDLGGVPGQPRLGFWYWVEPGAFGEGYLVQGPVGRFCGFFSVFVNAVYSFAGVETTSIAAAETKNPRRNIPRAAKHIFVRVFVFYILSLFVVGLIVPSNDPRLLTSTGDAAQSPFVIAAQKAGVRALPSIINAVVVTSAWSSGNHGLLQGSRSLYALALEGRAPSFFRKTSRWGIPYLCVVFQSAFMFLAYMSLDRGANTVFGWLSNLTASSTLAVWIVIGICSLRVRWAMKVQGISQNELPYSAPLQPYLAHVVLWFSCFIMLTGGFYVFVDGQWDVSDFFSSYFTIPLSLGLYFGWKALKKTSIVPLDKVPVADFIAIAKANPEPPLRKRKGVVGWFGRFWWD